MLTSSFNSIGVTGISCAVPTRYVSNEEYIPLFGGDTVKKVMNSTGVRGGYCLEEKQTASDLAYVAARNLLETRGVDPQSISVLIFAVTYPDYFVPATSFVLQKRLGLPQDCIVFDINLACSAFVYGLQLVAALLSATSAARGLLLVGDSTSKAVSPGDKSRMLFGDAGGAALLERVDARGADTIMDFALKSDGTRFKSIIVPAGAYRLPVAPRAREEWFDGNTRSDYDLFMNGTDVFTFAMTDVPRLLRSFLDSHSQTTDDYDALVFHQPNAFILKHLARKINAPPEKVPLSLDKYGNTSGASIPITLCDAFAGQTGVRRLLLCGFGVGLSWGVASLSLDASCVLPVTHTNEYYADGVVAHNDMDISPHKL